jgi:hypothetical protein
VILLLACRKSSWTVFTSSPFAVSSVPKVWRKVCQSIRLCMPIAFATARICRFIRLYARQPDSAVPAGHPNHRRSHIRSCSSAPAKSRLVDYRKPAFAIRSRAGIGMTPPNVPGYATSLVIRHDEKHVGRPFGRNYAGRPPGHRFLCAFIDHSAELRGRRRERLTIHRGRGIGRTQLAGYYLSAAVATDYGTFSIFRMPFIFHLTGLSKLYAS